MLAVGTICSAAAGSCFGTSMSPMLQPAPTSCIHAYCCLSVPVTEALLLLLLSRTNLQKNNAISLLFCNRSVASFTSAIICTLPNYLSGLRSQPRAAPHRAKKTRRIRGQIHHFHRVSSSLQPALHLCHTSRHASNTMTLRYLNTVEDLRGQALGLWETVRQQGVFPPSVLAGLKRCICANSCALSQSVFRVAMRCPLVMLAE